MKINSFKENICKKHDKIEINIKYYRFYLNNYKLQMKKKPNK